MKVLFVGDIHNHMYIFDDIERLDNEYNFDKVIFVGDYVDDWNTDNHDSLKTLDKIFNLKQMDPNRYTFLIGNHELSYLGYPCSGHRYELDNLVRLKLIENIDKFELYTTVELNNRTYYCSHAGFTNMYLEDELQDDDTKWQDSLKHLNDNILDRLHLLTPCSYFRGGNYAYSSFVWTDMRELIYTMNKLLLPYQIVGHTPMKEIYHHNEPNLDIYFIDTHSTYRNGEPYGDKYYLIWDDDKFEIVK